VALSTTLWCWLQCLALANKCACGKLEENQRSDLRFGADCAIWAPLHQGGRLLRGHTSSIKRCSATKLREPWPRFGTLVETNELHGQSRPRLPSVELAHQRVQPCSSAQDGHGAETHGMTHRGKWALCARGPLTTPPRRERTAATHTSLFMSHRACASGRLRSSCPTPPAESEIRDRWNVGLGLHRVVGRELLDGENRS
jgi:hypothetical protein